MDNVDGFISRLELSLKSELPGIESQQKMAPGIRLENRHEFYRNAAVLILLCRKPGRWHFVLMRRPEYQGAHSGQVSLPGGMREEGDPDMESTALRETREELGIEEEEIHILGKLSRLHIPVSGIEVTPFVAHCPEIPEFHPDPAEVEYLIEVPLADLLNPEKSQIEPRVILCRIVRVPCFDFGGNRVWGATAMILSEFLDLLRSLGIDPE